MISPIFTKKLRTSVNVLIHHGHWLFNWFRQQNNSNFMENKQKKGSPVFLSKVVDIQLKVHLIWALTNIAPTPTSVWQSLPTSLPSLPPQDERWKSCCAYKTEENYLTFLCCSLIPCLLSYSFCHILTFLQGLKTFIMHLSENGTGKRQQIPKLSKIFCTAWLYRWGVF